MTAPATYSLPEGSLPQTALQEQLSVAYVHMIASAAGCSLERHDTDYDGVDLTIASKVRYPMYRSPKVDLQLKCTTQNIVKDAAVSWSINRRTWEHIADPDRYVPNLLGILVVPGEVNAWLDHDENRLLTKSVMYWAWGRDLKDFPEGQESCTFQIPRDSRFTAATLLQVMQTIGSTARS